MLAAAAARSSVLDLPDSPRENIKRRKLLIIIPVYFASMVLPGVGQYVQPEPEQ